MCWFSKAGLPLNAKHIISCCKKVAGEICARHDIVVNILLNNILIERIDRPRAEVGGTEGGADAQ